MKTSILILLLTFNSFRSYSNGESSGKSIKDVSGDSNITFEAPTEEDSPSIQKNLPLYNTNLSIKTTRSHANPFSFHAIKSLFFPEKCSEPNEMKSISKNEKLLYKILKILLVTLSIGLVGLFVSMASVSMLLFVIPL
ncbi:MAG: hypothetical protein Q8M29_06665 [Bacteroidota bacterium]|nr:hypothetical protein [Bacteroidota bacterium]